MPRHIRSYKLSDIQAIATEFGFSLEIHRTRGLYPRSFCLMKYGPSSHPDKAKPVVVAWTVIINPATKRLVTMSSEMTKEEWRTAIINAIREIENQMATHNE